MPSLAETRASRRAAVPDRVLYNPAKDGKPHWKPVKGMAAGAFSRPTPDEVFLQHKEEARLGELMERFGLGPGGTGQMADSTVPGLEGEVD